LSRIEYDIYAWCASIVGALSQGQTLSESCRLYWREEMPDLAAFKQPVLPYAYGRSYGDSCLNEGGVVSTLAFEAFIAFDEEKGVLRCEAGVSFAEVLTLGSAAWLVFAV